VADNAHNVYLGLLVNLGLPGLLLYLALMAAAAVRALRGGTAHGAALLCALTCAWAEGFFGLGLPLTAPLLWIFWALAGTENIKEEHR
jgi:O-antigen ligase